VAIERIVERLGRVPDVTGLVLGGSRARGGAPPDADIDIGIYYRARRPPDIVAIRAAACELDDRGAPDGFADYGEWGPWIDGGAWLVVAGHRTDFLFRDVDRVKGVLSDCEEGTVVTAYQPGHPHCFVNHMYAGELFYSVTLFDPDDAVAALRQRTDPYPEILAGAVMRSFGWEAEFALRTAGTSAKRGDVAYVTGCLYRSIACMVQALFAANRTYLLNEKAAVRRVEDLERHPDAFAARAEMLLGALGESSAGLLEALDDADRLREETQSVLEASGISLIPRSGVDSEPSERQ